MGDSRTPISTLDYLAVGHATADVHADGRVVLGGAVSYAARAAAALGQRAGVVTHGGQRPGYRGFLFVDLRVRALCVLLANGERGGDVNREVSGLAADLAGRLRA